MSQHLLAPITLRDLTVRNRIWVPPMCQYSVAAGDGAATDYHQIGRASCRERV